MEQTNGSAEELKDPHLLKEPDLPFWMRKGKHYLVLPQGSEVARQQTSEDVGESPFMFDRDELRLLVKVAPEKLNDYFRLVENEHFNYSMRVDAVRREQKIRGYIGTIATALALLGTILGPAYLAYIKYDGYIAYSVFGIMGVALSIRISGLKLLDVLTRNLH
jgi:hypothetical protein